jgi:hypothetical protein
MENTLNASAPTITTLSAARSRTNTLREIMLILSSLLL